MGIWGIWIFVFNWSLTISNAAVETLTIDRIREIIDSSAPELRVARSESIASEANLGKAWGAAYPNISVNSAILANLFVAKQTIFDGGRLIGVIRQSSEEDKVAKLKIHDRMIAVSLKAAEGFYLSAMLIRQRENVLEYFEQLKKIADFVAKAGRLRKASVESVRMMASQRDIFASKVEQLNLNIQTVLQKLAADLGYDEITAEQIRDPLDISSVNIQNSQQWVQDSLTYDPAVLVANRQEDILNEQRTVALSEDNPQVSVFVTLGVGGSGESSKSFFSNYASGFRFGVLLNIPIFSGLSSVYKKDFYNEKTRQAILFSEQVKLQGESDVKIRGRRLLSNVKVVSNIEESKIGIRKEWDLAKREIKAELIAPSAYVAMGRTFLDSEESYYQLVRQILTDYQILKIRSEVSKKLSAKF